MRLPRQVGGEQLSRALRVLGYEVTRQTGSHLRLTCTEPAEHHVTIPRHGALRVGTLANLLTEIATFHGLTRDQLLSRLFGR